MSRQNAIGIRIEEGSNSNGRWLRVGNTLQQFGTITLTFNANASLRGTWTFPTAFGSGGTAIRIPSIALRGRLANAAPNVQQVSCLSTNTEPTTTSVQITLFRVTGQTNFVTGDTALIDVMAVGPAPS